MKIIVIFHSLNKQSRNEAQIYDYYYYLELVAEPEAEGSSSAILFRALQQNRQI